MIGLPVTARTESAAPPRASPSSFVITTPSNSATSAKLSATLTASWPVIASSTSSTFIGVVALRTRASSSISSWSTCTRPAVSTISTSRPSALACSRAHFATLTGSLSPGLRVEAGLGLGGELLQLLDRRRALQVAGGHGHVPVVLAQELRQLGGRGRLARALQPGHQDHGRRVRSEGEIAAGAAHQLGELVVDRLDHGLAGVERLADLGAGEALAQRGCEVLDDLEVDVGLEQRQTDLAQGLVDVLLGELPPRADVGEHALEAL